MTFEQSSSDTANAIYTIEVIDGEGRGLAFTATAGNASVTVYEAIFQALVDAVEAAEPISISYAQRHMAAVQQVTPGV